MKKKIIKYPCFRKYVKNILILIDNSRFLKDRKISPITGAVLGKSFFIRTCVLDNTFYGIDQIYNKEANKKEVYFEHGYYLGEVIPEDEKADFIKTIYTISKQRASFLPKALEKDVKYVTPYIVESEICEFTKKNILELKYKTGKKIRLFIPGHSEKRNKMLLSNPIEDNEFITVVLLYYLDYEQVDKYKENIYVSCGHINDPNYLKRLKSLLLYSDYIVTDFFGTHVVYGEALNVNMYFLGDIEKMNIRLFQLYEKLHGINSEEQKKRLNKEILDVTKTLL